MNFNQKTYVFSFKNICFFSLLPHSSITIYENAAIQRTCNKKERVPNSTLSPKNKLIMKRKQKDLFIFFLFEGLVFCPSGVFRRT